MGTGPGENEDITGRPFKGLSGDKLRPLLNTVGIGPNDAFITNIVMCRPPDNRDPKPDEWRACQPRLWATLAVLEPLVLVAMGKVAVNALVGGNAAIANARGQWFNVVVPGKFIKYPLPMYATFHPAGLLRKPDKSVYGNETYWEQDVKIAWEAVQALTNGRFGKDGEDKNSEGCDR